MFESASIEEDETKDELPVSHKRSLPAKSGPKKKAGLPKATASEIKHAALWSSSEDEGAVATPSGGQTNNEVPCQADEVLRNYGLRNFLGSVSECR